jgi:hypothetical protein
LNNEHVVLSSAAVEEVGVMDVVVSVLSRIKEQVQQDVVVVLLLLSRLMQVEEGFVDEGGKFGASLSATDEASADEIFGKRQLTGIKDDYDKGSSRLKLVTSVLKLRDL